MTKDVEDMYTNAPGVSVSAVTCALPMCLAGACVHSVVSHSVADSAVVAANAGKYACVCQKLVRNIHLLKGSSDLEGCHNLGINLIHNFEQPQTQLSELCNKQALCKRGSCMSGRLTYIKLASILMSQRSAVSRAFTHS